MCTYLWERQYSLEKCICGLQEKWTVQNNCWRIRFTKKNQKKCHTNWFYYVFQIYFVYKNTYRKGSSHIYDVICFSVSYLHSSYVQTLDSVVKLEPLENKSRYLLMVTLTMNSNRIYYKHTDQVLPRCTHIVHSTIYTNDQCLWMAKYAYWEAVCVTRRSTMVSVRLRYRDSGKVFCVLWTKLTETERLA